MIRHELSNTTLRFYTDPTDDQFAPYCAICSLIWETPRIVWVRGLHGTLSRALLHEMALWMHSEGVVTIKAHRDTRHSLPFGRRTDDHVEVSIADLLMRWNLIEKAAR